MLEALQVLEHLLDDPINGNVNVVWVVTIFHITLCIYIGDVPGTTEVSPKLQFPLEPLVKYLQDKHGLTQEGVFC